MRDHYDFVKMKKNRTAICMLIAGALLLAARGNAGPTNTQCKLAVQLSDGSLVIGVPEITHLHCDTSYASLEIPLKAIDHVTIKDDSEQASVALRNGDQLSVVLNSGDIAISTLFGDVSLPIQHVAELSVHVGELDLRGMVLHYSFDKDHGNRILDESGNKYDARAHGAKWVEQGRRGGAYLFDGAGDFIALPNEAKQHGPFSVSIWFTCEETGDSASLYGGGGLDCAVDRNGIAITWAHKSQSLYLDVYDTPKRYATKSEKSEVNITDGQWHHAVGTYDGEDLELYVDGQIARKGKKEIGSITIDWTNAAHCLGKRAERVGQTWYWKGKMDEVMIFNRALSSQEVGYLHRQVKPSGQNKSVEDIGRDRR